MANSLTSPGETPLPSEDPHIDDDEAPPDSDDEASLETDVAVFQVDGRLFRLPQRSIERTWLGGLIGPHDANPFVLEDIGRGEFSLFVSALRDIEYHGLPGLSLEELKTVLTLAGRWDFDLLEEHVVDVLTNRFPPEINIAFYESLEEDIRYIGNALLKHYLVLIKRVEPLLPSEEQQLSIETTLRIMRLRRLAREHYEHVNVPWEREQVSSGVTVGDDVIESLIDDAVLYGCLETSPLRFGLNLLETDLDEIMASAPEPWPGYYTERWEEMFEKFSHYQANTIKLALYNRHGRDRTVTWPLYFALIKQTEPLLTAEEQQIGLEAASRIVRLRRLARGYYEHVNTAWKRVQVSGTVSTSDNAIVDMIDDSFTGFLELSPFRFGLNLLNTCLEDIVACASGNVGDDHVQRWEREFEIFSQSQPLATRLALYSRYGNRYSSTFPLYLALVKQVEPVEDQHLSLGVEIATRIVRLRRLARGYYEHVNIPWDHGQVSGLVVETRDSITGIITDALSGFLECSPFRFGFTLADADLDKIIASAPATLEGRHADRWVAWFKILEERGRSLPPVAILSLYERWGIDKTHHATHYVVLVERLGPLLPSEEPHLGAETALRLGRLRRLARGYYEQLNTPWQRGQVFGPTCLCSEEIEALVSDMLAGVFETSPFRFGNIFIDTHLRELLRAAPEDPEGNHAQNWIDWLDKTLYNFSPGTDSFTQILRKLRRLCRKASCVPKSCYIKAEITLDRDDPLFQSNFSDVYIGILGGAQVALKALRMNIGDRANVTKAFSEEVVVWKRLSHTNIVPFLGASDKFPVCLVSVWMPNGSIRSYLERNPTSNRAQWLLDICNGLAYMHTAGVVHGDLKGGNVLISEDKRACLTDFGLATLTHHSGTSTNITSAQGTLRWMPPEQLSADPGDDSNLHPTTAGDIYSLGMTWYEIFALNDPFFEHRFPHAAIPHIIEGRRPARPATADTHGLPDTIWNIIESCWKPKPQDRPEISAVAERLAGHMRAVNERAGDGHDIVEQR